MSIPHLNIAGGDTVSTLETILNAVVDKVVDSITFDATTRVLTITFQDASTLTATLPSQQNYVVSGCTVTRSSALAYAVASGYAQAGGQVYAVTGSTVTLNVADGTNYRYDAIVVDAAGALQKRTGVAANPTLMPTLSAGDLVLAYVNVPPLGTWDDQIMFTLPDSYTGRSTRRVLKATGGVLNHEHIIIASTASAAGPFTVQLPDPTQVEGAVFRIFDDGNAGTHNVTLQAPAGNINGAATYTINNNYRMVTLTAYQGDYYGG
jgi:hypothetical protein